ncbi:hypothetical protein Tco_0304411 [Tanacetum coccineum]
MTGAKFDIEKFDGTGDFGLWRIKMRALLIQHGFGSIGREALTLEDVMATQNSKEIKERSKVKGDDGEGLYVRGRTDHRDSRQSRRKSRSKSRSGRLNLGLPQTSGQNDMYPHILSIGHHQQANEKKTHRRCSRDTKLIMDNEDFRLCRICTQETSKLDPREKNGVLLGYPEGVKGLQTNIRLEWLNNYTPEEDQTDQEDGVDEDVGDQETDQPPDLTDYQLVRDREPRTRMKPLRKNKTWELVDPPVGKKLVSSKWLCAAKKGKGIKVFTSLEQWVDGLPSLCLKKEFDHERYLGEAKKILGMEIVRDRSRKILRVSQSGDCDVERMGKVSYENAVGSLMYLMVCTRPDIAYSLKSMLLHAVALSTTESSIMESLTVADEEAIWLWGLLKSWAWCGTEHNARYDSLDEGGCLEVTTLLELMNVGCYEYLEKLEDIQREGLEVLNDISRLSVGRWIPQGQVLPTYPGGCDYKIAETVIKMCMVLLTARWNSIKEGDFMLDELEETENEDIYEYILSLANEMDPWIEHFRSLPYHDLIRQWLAVFFKDRTLSLVKKRLQSEVLWIREYCTMTLSNFVKASMDDEICNIHPERNVTMEFFLKLAVHCTVNRGSVTADERNVLASFFRTLADRFSNMVPPPELVAIFNKKDMQVDTIHVHMFLKHLAIALVMNDLDSYKCADPRYSSPRSNSHVSYDLAAHLEEWTLLIYNRYLNLDIFFFDQLSTLLISNELIDAHEDRFDPIKLPTIPDVLDYFIEDFSTYCGSEKNVSIENKHIQVAAKVGVAYFTLLLTTKEDMKKLDDAFTKLKKENRFKPKLLEYLTHNLERVIKAFEGNGRINEVIDVCHAMLYDTVGLACSEFLQYVKVKQKMGSSE